MNLVKKSLLACVGLLLLLLGLQGAVSLWQVRLLGADTTEVLSVVKLEVKAEQLWARFTEADQTLKQALDFADTESAVALRARFAERAKALQEAQERLQAGARGDLQANATQVGAAVQAWLALAAPHMGQAGVTELPSYHRLDGARDALQQAVLALGQHSVADAADAIEAAAVAVRTAQAVTVGVLLAAVLVGVLLGRYALASLHRQLGADASEVARAAQAAAGGDLTQRIDASAYPAGSVMEALARMQQALREAVARVHGIGTQLASGSDEIANGNSDLSRRTEQQAAALERTAATMEQLGTAVRHNAEQSAQASSLAEDASAVARKGGQVVAEAVTTMRAIHESSRRIADIIGTIDGIAFQTNILALNAAVEAARAGEQGRGFAVVAGEVRSLAQRSADAARQIKQLIGASTDRVESGAAMVEACGRTMQEVVESIARVSAVMGEIRTASQQQSAGVAEVGSTVSELDRSTQQNAALAEQSAAAADHLRTQGGALVEAMAFFRLERQPG